MFIMEKERLYFEEIKSEFLKTWPKVKAIIAERDEDDFDDESKMWLLDALEYNVQNGKMLRGLLAVTAFMKFSNKSLQDKEMEGAYLLGWGIEILQGACLVADDIMDNSETRRGKPCWYKLPNVGMNALNDARMLSYASCIVMAHAFYDTEFYVPLVNLCSEICFKTTVGQNLDAQTQDIEKYSMKRYEKLVKYKTSYYSFVAPVLAGHILASKETKCSNEDIELIKEILFNIGLVFQVQDDMLDVFGDPEVTGKIGTDIQDRKCTWLLAKYLEDATVAEVENMKNYFEDPKANYEKIKQLYQENDIEEKCDIFLEGKSSLITELCYELQNKEIGNLVLTLLEQISFRKF